MDEKQRKQRKTHPVHPKENVVNGPGAPVWLAKSHLTVFSTFLLVCSMLLCMSDLSKTMSTTWVLSRSVSLKDPKGTSFSPTASL